MERVTTASGWARLRASRSSPTRRLRGLGAFTTPQGCPVHNDPSCATRSLLPSRGRWRAPRRSGVPRSPVVLVDNGIVTPGEIRKANFGRSLWRGYDRVGVDELLERCAIQVEAHQSPSALIAATPLELERRGYRRSEVDRFLKALATEDLTDSQNRGSSTATSGPPRRWMSWRDLVGLYIVLSIVGAIFRGSWVGYLIGALVIAIFVVMVVWRRRSGIETWTFMSTIAGLLTRVRPTRQGLVRPEHPDPVDHKDSHESFDHMARRLHDAVDDT